MRVRRLFLLIFLHKTLFCLKTMDRSFRFQVRKPKHDSSKLQELVGIPKHKLQNSKKYTKATPSFANSQPSINPLTPFLTNQSISKISTKLK